VGSDILIRQRLIRPAKVTGVRMTEVVMMVIGAVVLCLVWADRGNVRGAWRNPAKFWARNPHEYARSREPSQPLNVVLGTVLGIVAVVYGVVSLVT
jgi:hypothetical protein